MWNLTDTIAAVGGQRLDSSSDPVPYSGVTTDSRADCSGQLFVALRGDNHDGHDYVAAAAKAGAVAALVSRPVSVDIPQWCVPDTRLALGQFAAAWRARLSATVIAITGSNGKTTCKTLTAAILSQVGRTQATVGNLNNDIGVPLTLLAARDAEYLVVEMGANHPGEIAYLVNITRPDIAVITNAGRAHLEGFGSVAGVAQAKGEIIDGAAAGSTPPPFAKGGQGGFPHTVIFPADSPWTEQWQQRAGARHVVTFGLTPAAAVHLSGDMPVAQWAGDRLAMTFDVTLPHQSAPLTIQLPLAGAHHVRNALAALSVAAALQLPATAMQTGLAQIAPVGRRLQAKTSQSGLRLLDDTYNANPDSVAAGIAVLVALAPPAQTVLILGNCGELGADSVTLHQEMGQQARAAGVAQLYTVGSLAAHAAAAFGDAATNYPDQSSLLAAVRDQFTAAQVILIKGSHSAAMDRIVDVMETW